MADTFIMADILVELYVHAMYSIHAIITKGIVHAAKIAELEVGPEEALNDEEVLGISCSVAVNA